VNQKEMNEAFAKTLQTLEVRLRDKLSVLLPALDLLEKRVAPAGEAVLRYLADARRTALSILRLANNLGDQAKYAVDYDMADPVYTDLSALFSSIAAETRSMAEYKRVSVTLTCSETPFFAYVDPAMVSRILFNLLSNAVLHGEGDVSAELSREVGFLLMTVHNAGGSGSNLYDSNLLGTGLSVVSAIVCQCGGTMMASSDEKNGTSVTISLPDLPGCDDMEFSLPDDPCAFPRFLVELSDFPVRDRTYNLQRGEPEPCTTSTQ
jgi:signal transduction histidine kinase